MLRNVTLRFDLTLVTLNGFQGDGVVVDDLGRAGGLERGEQGPLSFNYDL